MNGAPLTAEQILACSAVKDERQRAALVGAAQRCGFSVDMVRRRAGFLNSGKYSRVEDVILQRGPWVSLSWEAGMPKRDGRRRLWGRHNVAVSAQGLLDENNRRADAAAALILADRPVVRVFNEMKTMRRVVTAWGRVLDTERFDDPTARQFAKRKIDTMVATLQQFSTRLGAPS